MVWHGIFLGYVFGIFLGSLWSAPILSGACFALGVLLVSVWYDSRSARVFAAVLFMIGWGYWHARETVDFWQASREERTVEGIAQIVAEPEEKERSREVLLRFSECREGECPSELVAASFSPYTEVSYGEKVSVRCPLKIPASFSDDFDYRMYAASRGIAFLCYPQQWSRVSEEGGSFLMRGIFSVRHALEHHLEAVVPYPESGFGAGLLLGGNGRMTQETQNAFSRTGMTHIVAVSGSNVALVAECFFLVAIACGLWRRQALLVSGIGVAVFVIMVGAGASAVRAGIMGSLIIIANMSGRASGGLRLWSLALCLMLWWNPLLLRYDLGFQLSFLATLGILVCLPRFQEWSDRKSPESGRFLAMLREVLWMTLSAEAFVLPIIFFNFHTASTFSLVANILVIPAIPLAMALCFLAALSGFFFFPLAKFFGVMAYFVLHGMLFVIETLSDQQYASLPIRSFGVWAATAWYGFLLLFLIFLQKRSNKPLI